MKVEVRPIERKKWHGKKGQESFTRPIKLNVLVDTNTMRYATGLTEEEEEKYGKLLNADLSSHYNPEVPHPFWDSNMGIIKLKNSTMVFETDMPLDYVKVKNLKASKYVANSMKEYEEGMFPEATHVIFDEREEIEVQAAKIAMKDRAKSLVSELSKERKIQLIMLIEGKNLKNQSDSYVIVEMDKVLASSPKEVLRYLDMDKESMTTQALVEECLQKNVLQKKGHKIFYSDSNLGTDVVDVADYLNDIENQDLKLRLMEQVK